MRRLSNHSVDHRLLGNQAGTRMTGIKAFYLPLIILVFVFNCSRKEYYVDFNSGELSRLICGDSIKEWVRIRETIDGVDQNSNPCDIQKIYRFYKPVADSNAIYKVYLNPDVCNGQDSMISQGKWSIINEVTGANTNDSILMILGKDTLHYGIRTITSEELILKGVNNGKTIENDFNKVKQ